MLLSENSPQPGRIADFKTGFNPNNNEFRIKKSYNHILKPGIFVKQLQSQVISDNKVLVDFNMENNCSEYSLLMHYCDEDLITYFSLSKKNNDGYKEKYTKDDFNLSF